MVLVKRQGSHAALCFSKCFGSRVASRRPHFGFDFSHRVLELDSSIRPRSKLRVSIARDVMTDELSHSYLEATHRHAWLFERLGKRVGGERHREADIVHTKAHSHRNQRWSSKPRLRINEEQMFSVVASSIII